MNDKSTATEVILMNGIPRDVSRALDRPSCGFSRWTSRRKRWLLGGILIISALITFPNPAGAQLGDIFSKLFSSIKSDMGSSLSDINQITQSLQKLYQTTMWPLAAINQSRGFVVNSISKPCRWSAW